LTAPSQEKIDQIKQQFPDRPLFLVDAVDSEEQVMTFVMTGPTRDEYRFYTNKMLAAKETKDQADQLWEMRMIAENAALSQIRWPDREECKKAFEMRPEMVDNFHAELRKAAGSLIEFRSKKL
jgi:hypothetical protein